jgi:nitrate/nitrite transporter NarK
MNHTLGWMGGWMSSRMGGRVWIWPVSAALIAALVIVVIVKLSRKKS